MMVSSRIGRRQSMAPRWIARVAGLSLAAVALAACGGGGDGYGGAAPPAGGSGGSSAGAVAVKDVPDVGAALVDGAGKTMYFSDQEAGGSIKCLGDCLGFWFPVPGDAKTAASASVKGLAVLHRSDKGMDQLTYQGKPLYTFRLDSGPAQHNGQNLDDSFGGTKFTWHAATTSGAAATANPSSAPTSAPSSYDNGNNNGY
jgi:predicted lipoprotein with Yx(FWY)xxD motif